MLCVLYARQCDGNHRRLKQYQMPSSIVLLKVPVHNNIRNACQDVNQCTASSMRKFSMKKQPPELNSVLTG